MAEQSPFAKDFGYLIPFLDKVKAHVEGLPEGPGKAELQGLLASQVTDWKRVKALLSGAEASGDPSPESADQKSPDAPAPEGSTPASLAPVETFIAPEGHTPKAWSIGSSIAATPQANQSGAPGGLSVGSLIGVKRSL